MTFGRKAPGLSVFTLACVWILASTLIVPSSQAQLPDLVVEVGDTTAASGATNTVISIFLSNYNDTVAGFNLWVQLDRPDIMLFQTDYVTILDTTYWKCLQYDGPDCIDSQYATPLDYDFIYIEEKEVALGSWDTTGTIMSGWQSVAARSLSGFGYDLNIIGIANMPSGDTIPGIAPQGGGLLIKLLADVLDVPDTLQDRDVNIIVNHQFIDHFSFSKPDGSAIGLKDSVIADTNYYVCTAWAGEVCLNWQRVSMPPADSTEILPDTINVIDLDNVIIDDGSLTVLGGFCGDLDGSGSPEANVADLTFMVAYLFQGGPAPVPSWVGDVDCNGSPTEPNVGDLTYLVAYLFQGGPAPCEGPNCN